MAGGSLERFLGGSPVAVVVKLVLLSLVVGFLLTYFGLTAWDLFEWVQTSIARLWRQGWRALGDVGQWLVAGAIIVVPLWLLSRVLSRRR
jgi:Ca2+-dependent lipid-binding protein